LQAGFPLAVGQLWAAKRAMLLGAPARGASLLWVEKQTLVLAELAVVVRE